MGLFIKEKSQPRSFIWLWAIHLVAFIFSVIVLGITAGLIANLRDVGYDGFSHCGSHPKMNFNLAVAVISFIILIYPIFSTGPHLSSRFIPWSVYIQLGLDSLLFVFWLASAATSPVSCSDLCSACSSIPANFYLDFDSRSCTCYNRRYYNKRDTSPNPQNQPLGKRRTYRTYSSGYHKRGSKIAAREAFDAILTVLFAVCIGGTIWYIIRQRKNASTHNPENKLHASPMEPLKPDEAGKTPSVVVAPAYPQQEQPMYNTNQIPTQSNYGGQQPVYQQQQQVPPSAPPVQQWANPPQQPQPQYNEGLPGAQPNQDSAQQYYNEQPGAGVSRGPSEMHSPGPDEVARKSVGSH